MTTGIATTYNDLTGIGLEFVVHAVTGDVICKFFDGNIVRENVAVRNSEETLWTV